MYSVLSVQAVSNVIGAAEIIFTILIALRFFSAHMSAVGSTGAILMTLTTLSFYSLRRARGRACLGFRRP
jgi:uncharacterized membrane protein YkgB